MTDPYKGAKKEGGIGFVKGVGRGIMSVPFRVMGGAWAVPGYAMKGLYQEMVKNKRNNVQNYIIAARVSQGCEEASEVTQEERDAIVKRWSGVKPDIKKKRNPKAEKTDSLHSLVQQKKMKQNERSARLTSQTNAPDVQLSQPGTPTQQGSLSGQYPDPPRRRGVEPEIRSTMPSWRQQEAGRTRALRRQDTATSGSVPGTPSLPSQSSQAELEAQLRAEEEEDQRELERAIAASVAESSRGNAEQDRLLASAIRASVAELERAPTGTNASQQDEEEALHRALTASMEEAGKTNITEEEQRALEETLRKSLLETRVRRQHGSDSEWDSDADTEEGEEYRRIIAESKELAHMHANYPEDYATSAQGAQQESGVMYAMSQALDASTDGSTDMGTIASPREVHHGDSDADLQRVLEESEKAETERMQMLEKQQTEEDIVMEYVRKQSLLEEQHRQRVVQGRDTRGGGSNAASGM